MASVSVESLRAEFPAFSEYPDWAYMENAGGSQVPTCVLDGMTDYMKRKYVQLGAGYPMAKAADDVIAGARHFEEVFMGAGDSGKVALGPSTSAMVELLARGYEGKETGLKLGDEVIVSEAAHEANKGPWTRMAERTGAKLVMWPIDRETFQTCPIPALGEILSPRTRIVAFPHVSNLLGEVVNIEEVVKAVREVSPNARIIADGVAYAPHHAIDVEKWGVDWYVYSFYKVFGPHMAGLFGRHECWQEIVGQNHFFVGAKDMPYKFELGGVNHEGCAARVALIPYLNKLAGRKVDTPFDRSTVIAAYETIERLESALTTKLLTFLRTLPRVTVYASTAPGAKQCTTISFIHESLKSSDISAHCHEAKVAVRHGHMYAFHLTEALGLDTVEGVVRVSMLHYNTHEEVDRLISALSQLFRPPQANGHS
eukprot:comp11738_c0_seq1/m.6324 comp11738_c0_seq1/g.6324  ORF comp11738_c0_seq1/g.6324 comp11738_c0_seq1/m.6324 type:complete len:426 (-) comp11738_c0_seq1:248-1525(-)